MKAALQDKPKASSNAPPTFTPVRSGLLQRKCACGGTPGPSGECEECRKKKLQRRANNSPAPSSTHPSSSVSEAPPIVHEVLRSPGQPLDGATRAFMEPRLGHDFSQVRVHTDAQAAESAQAMKALAYTVGRHIVFAEGQHQPSASDGKLLLAHELTHVVQQLRGGADIAYRQVGDTPASAGVAIQTESGTTARLLGIIEDIKLVQKKAGQNRRDQGAGHEGRMGSGGQNETITNFIAQLLEVAHGNDEQLKLSVLAGFSSEGIERAEAQLSELPTAVREPSHEIIATKSLAVSHPQDAMEIEANRVAETVVHGTAAIVTGTATGGCVNRQAAQALAGAGAAVLAWETASLPLTSWNPPGWVVLGIGALVATALIVASRAASDDDVATDDESDPCMRDFLICMGTSLASQSGSVPGSNRCQWCFEACRREGRGWPRSVPSTRGSMRCDYWNF
jgi:Domain of unknown function (DUF4157)